MDIGDPVRLRAAPDRVAAAGPAIAVTLACIAGLTVNGVAARLEPQLRLAIVMEFVAIQSFVPLGGLVLLRPRRLRTRGLAIATAAVLDIHYPRRTLLFCLYFFGPLAMLELTRFYERLGK